MDAPFKIICKITLLISALYCSTCLPQDIGDLLDGGASNNKDPDITKSISVKDDTPTDEEITDRLTEIFDQIDDLADVEVAVNSGVVELQGEVVSKSAESQAIGLANQLNGVVNVENNLQRVNDIETRISYTFDNLKERSLTLISYIPLLIVAFIVISIFWLIGNLVTRWDQPFQRITKNVFIIDLLKQITRGIIIIVGCLIGLQIIDATALLGSLLGAVGLIGLAVGFAIKDTVENYIASILLSLRQPFSPNDHIVIDSYEGKVIRLTSRATILLTLDGNHIRVPNSIVYKGVLINYTHNPERRFMFEVGVDTNVNLTAARALVIKTLLATRGVIPSPPPSCQIQSLGDSNVLLLIFGWTDQRRFDLLKVRSACIQAVKENFDATGFDMPEPIYRLRLEGMTDDQVDEIASATSESVTAVEDQSSPSNKAHIEEALDVSRETELDEKVLSEAAEEDDLLRHDAPKE